jgi:hypothetical protein
MKKLSNLAIDKHLSYLFHNTHILLHFLSLVFVLIILQDQKKSKLHHNELFKINTIMVNGIYVHQVIAGFGNVLHFYIF